jgi:hypothetical protein
MLHYQTGRFPPFSRWFAAACAGASVAPETKKAAVFLKMKTARADHGGNSA